MTIMLNDQVIDQVVVTNDPCTIKLQFIERRDDDSIVYVVRFMVGSDEPKETVSRDRQFIEDAYNNCKLVVI